MEIAVSDVLVGVMTTVLGLLGLVLAAGAIDDGIHVFGICLAGFAVLFLFGLIRRHFDRQDALRQGGRPHV